MEMSKVAVNKKTIQLAAPDKWIDPFEKSILSRQRNWYSELQKAAENGEKAGYGRVYGIKLFKVDLWTNIVVMIKNGKIDHALRLCESFSDFILSQKLKSIDSSEASTINQTAINQSDTDFDFNSLLDEAVLNQLFQACTYPGHCMPKVVLCGRSKKPDDSKFKRVLKILDSHQSSGEQIMKLDKSSEIALFNFYERYQLLVPERSGNLFWYNISQFPVLGALYGTYINSFARLTLLGGMDTELLNLFVNLFVIICALLATIPPQLLITFNTGTWTTLQNNIDACGYDGSSGIWEHVYWIIESLLFLSFLSSMGCLFTAVGFSILKPSGNYHNVYFQQWWRRCFPPAVVTGGVLFTSNIISIFIAFTTIQVFITGSDNDLCECVRRIVSGNSTIIALFYVKLYSSTICVCLLFAIVVGFFGIY